MMQLHDRVQVKDLRNWVVKYHPFREADYTSIWLLKALDDVVRKLQELEERIEDLEREVLE